jgi:hypothetical protein
MHEIFATAQRGINTIFYFMLLAVILAMGAFLIEKHRLKGTVRGQT